MFMHKNYFKGEIKLEKLLFDKGYKYIILLFAVALGFFTISYTGFPQTESMTLVKQFLFVAIPVVTWLILSKKSFLALFHTLTLKGIFKAVLGTIIIYGASFILGVIYQFSTNFSARPNPITTSSIPWYGWIMNYFQLFGEEILTVAFLLAIFALVSKFLGYRASIIIASILSALIFSAAHYWTYGSLIHPLLLLTIPRLGFTFIFLKAEKKPSIVSSWITHSLFDSISFIIGSFL